MDDSRPNDIAHEPLIPFLKWPGGKRWIAPILSKVFAGELCGTYREPFLGAGAVFLQLRPENAYLSDSNKELIEFLVTVRDSPQEVVERVWRWSNTRECYGKVRASKPRTDLGKAARFLYLNRTCWGGVYRTNLAGDFNVPFGDSGRRICTLSDVVTVGRAFRSSVLRACDFEEAVEMAGQGDVIYADPPYTGKGEDNGFLRYNETIFSWSDQQRLARSLKRARSKGAFVVCSGLHHRELFRLYSGWWEATVPRYSGVSRVTSSRRSIREVLLFSRRPKVWQVCDSIELRRVAKHGGLT